MPSTPKAKFFVKSLAVFGFLSLILIYSRNSVRLYYKNWSDSSAENNYFRDIFSPAKVLPEDGKNIFFVESGDSTGNVTISSRQACSIESAALTNPHLKIFVLFVSHDRLKNLTVSEEVKAVLSYPNVHFYSINLKKLSACSPFESFFDSDKLKTSLYKVTHTSDVFRLLLLWKFGGTYIDTDVIVRQNLDSIPPNYACPESEVSMNGAIINFQSYSDNFLVQLFADDLITNFNGRSWGGNGPTMMTRVLKRLCNANDTLEMVSKENCEGFHVLPKDSCYAVGGMQSSELFTDSLAPATMKKIENSLVVHFWNAATKQWKLKKSQTAAYIQLAKQFCPKVMAQDGDSFDA